jgi:hypothetical protein
MRVVLPCPYGDGADLPVDLAFEGDPPSFNLSLTGAFVDHMNAEHGTHLDPVDL